MEVILLEPIQGLGARGEKVKVAPGYARNYLVPNRLAINASGAGAKVFEELDRQRQKRDLKARGTAEEFARKLAGVSVTIAVQAGEEDKLFGSVNSTDIAAKLTEQGIDVDRRKIQLDEPIKQLGEYMISIKLFTEVEGQIKVTVVKSD